MKGLPSPTHSVGDSVGFTAGSGSTRISAGLPERMYSAMKPCSSVCSDDGNGTSSASTSCVIDCSGLISTTSYCFRSSVTTDHCGVNWLC